MRILTALFLLISLTAHAQLQVIMDAENAFNSKDYNGYISLGEQLLPVTRHPNIIYRLAQAYAKQGNNEKAISFLTELAAKGVPIDPATNEAFNSLGHDERFTNATKKFKANLEKIDRSKTAFTVSEKHLIPEGIAVDPRSGSFYISSLAMWKVVKTNLSGSSVDFVPSDKHGLWMTLGMKVDVARNQLWVCSASEYDSTSGYSGVFVFDLTSGALTKKFVLDNKEEPHLFNDIVIDDQGNAYFTDSKAGKLFKVSPNNDHLQTLSSRFLYPNGIAIDHSGKNLYVADYTGLTHLNLSTKVFTKLNDNGAVFLEGIDGLMYYENSLIAIQDSGNKDDRVVRFHLGKDMIAIKKVEVLQSYRSDFAIPTTGTIYNGHYYYIANSFLRNLKSDRQILTPEVVKEPLILKLEIR